MSPVNTGQGGKAYWRSLDELASTPEFRSFVEREFPEHASEMLDGATRRSFLKIMGASIGLAGMTGCRWPRETIVPYAHRPEGTHPGVPKQFATAMEIGGVASGLLVTSYDGRPVKVEGNPLHPINQGACDVWGQAGVLDLYDPDRSKGLVRREGDQIIRNVTWNDFSAFITQNLTGLGFGNGLYFLSELSSSLSYRDMRQRLQAKYPQADWCDYEPLAQDQESAGARAAFGQAVRTHYHLDRANIIVSLEADLLREHPAALKYARDFARGRNPEGEMNRLYVIESAYSHTGAMADHRLPTPSGQIEALAFALASELIQQPNLAVPSHLQPAIEWLRANGEHTFDRRFLSAVARDLAANAGQSVIAAGPRQSAAVHALVHVLNAVLGNVGNTVTYTTEPNDIPNTAQAIAQLAQDVQAGKVQTLIIVGGNPVYNAPADIDFAGVLSKVPVSVHLSLEENETSALCHWHLPRAHYLETWGDCRAYDGTICSTQPLIAPLYAGKSPIELFAILLGEHPQNGYDIVRRTFQGLVAGQDFEPAWRRMLHDGVVEGSALPPLQLQLNAGPELQQLLTSVNREPALAAVDNLEVVFIPDACVYDGRFANNAWLQELPDFIAKLTWDNAAFISPKTAEALGVENQELVTLKIGDRALEIAAYIMPGQAPYSLALPLGYGRTAAGRIGNGVGFDTYRLRTSNAMHYVSGVTLTRSGETYPFSCTQDHFAIDKVGLEARQQRIGTLVREGTIDEYRAHSDFAQHRVHHPEEVDLWTQHDYPGHKWGMAVDLNTCIGCNACVVGCQAENNIPVVGKEQVKNGREMHWLRLDRYFAGDPDDAEIAHQPMACVHCETAPCEQVCPVAATVHSHEGLNVMVYNRCVGTRYCSNNCPYKVRRFNFFNYQKRSPMYQTLGKIPKTQTMQYNPEVTVRSRGVMEKCTYCIQRIEAKKIEAKNERRPIRDGEIVTACQQTCPTHAIVFGDLNDPNSQVAKLHAEQRAYAALGEFNFKPRTEYLARVRNPNPELSEQKSHEQHGHS